MTYDERVAYATHNRLCFACSHYERPFGVLSGICRLGGHNPLPTGDLLTPQQADDACIAATVRWANSCSSFTLAQETVAC